MKQVFMFGCIFLLVLGLGYAVVFSSSAGAQVLLALSEENGLIETVTWIFFLLSAVLSGLAALALPRKTFPLFLTCIGLIFFLDEISWGKDMFGYSSPGFMGVQIDAIHDFIDIGLNVFERPGIHPGFLMVLGWGILGCVAILIRFWKWGIERMRSGVAFARAGRTTLLLGMALLFFFLSILIDTEQIPILQSLHLPPQVLEEYFELSASVAFFIFCCSLLMHARNARRWPAGR